MNDPVLDQFLKALMTITGSESLRDECREIYKTQKVDMPLFKKKDVVNAIS